ncbi:MAG: hypothetical protein HYV96_02710 [Opitutae bacterium]|nr:hypothetical protein [Opitutae bacterium]
MNEADELRAQLRALQIELIEAAADFDRRGHLAAADFALATANRVGELCAGAETRLVGDAPSCLAERGPERVG